MDIRKGYHMKDDLLYNRFKEQIVPSAIEDLKSVLKRNHDTLEPKLRDALSGWHLVHKNERNIIGHGQHQLVLKLKDYPYNKKNYYFCAKLNRNIEESYYFDYLKLILMLGGSIEDRDGGFKCSSPYFIILPYQQKQEENAEFLRSLDLYVPFSTTVNLPHGNAVIAEDSSEGGKFYVEDATTYLYTNKDRNMKKRLDDIVEYIIHRAKITVGFGHPSVGVDSTELAVRKMFHVRMGKSQKNELIIEDLDHLLIRK